MMKSLCESISLLWKCFFRKVFIGLAIFLIILIGYIIVYRILCSFWIFDYTDFKDNRFGKNAQNYFSSIEPLPTGTTKELLLREEFKNGDYYRMTLTFPSIEAYDSFLDKLTVGKNYSVANITEIRFYLSLYSENPYGNLMLCADDYCCRIDIFFSDGRLIDEFLDPIDPTAEYLADAMYHYGMYTHRHCETQS